MAELVRRYDDLPLGTTEASVIALAERLGIKQIATLDHRHFRVVRPSHVEAAPERRFELTWGELKPRIESCWA